MAKFVTVSALSMVEPDFSKLPKDFSAYEKEIKSVLLREIDKAMVNCPDLIVFPECASRYAPNGGVRDVGELNAYYKYLGSRIEEFLQPIAVNNNVNIA